MTYMLSTVLTEPLKILVEPQPDEVDVHLWAFTAIKTQFFGNQIEQDE